MENVLILNFIIQLIFAVCYFLWQFDVLHFSERSMANIIVCLDIVETIILVMTRFYRPNGIGEFALGGFYIIEVVLLTCQLIFADLGFSIKIKSIFWIVFYVFLFFNDMFEINIFIEIFESDFLLAIDAFLKNSWFGELLVAIILTAFKMLFAYWIKKEND